MVVPWNVIRVATRQDAHVHTAPARSTGSAVNVFGPISEVESFPHAAFLPKWREATTDPSRGSSGPGVEVSPPLAMRE